MKPEIKTLQTAHFCMDYFCFGQGEKVMVILPGLSVQSVCATAAAVANAYRLFCKEFTVYVFDRRSDLPPHYTVADMAEDTAAAFSALGLRDIYLFGASQGGMMALTIACRYPKLIKKLAVGSTCIATGDTGDTAIERWAQLARQGDVEALYLDFGKCVYPPETFEKLRSFLSVACKEVSTEELARFVTLAEGTRAYSVIPILPRLSCPVLALTAADDAVLGAAAGEQLIRALQDKPDFECHTYTGFGHAAYDTAPDYKQRLFDFFIK